MRPSSVFPFAVAAGLCATVLVSTFRAADDGSTSASGPTDAVRKTLKDPGSRKAEPLVNPPSDEGENAIQRMKLPEGLEIKLWAAEPMLGNPVAFNIDEKGRIFVAETYRYRTSTLDIRDYRWMLEDDLAFRNVDQRLATLEKHFGADGIKELSQETELVRLLEDTNGDGIGDRSTIYADGFNTALDGIASGVMARRGEVWFTNIPSIWKFTGERKAETRTEISRGYGVRFSFTGHDLHGLTWGPDGKIYFSFGDRGASVKTKEGTTLDTPDMGAVYRMNPDGSEMEIVADGMRNPQSLLFTENGDLFTGDNDSDMGDEERLVHVVEGGDSGWRIGYQHSPLSPTERIGPWSLEKMWQPRQLAGEIQPAFILPPICNIEDGPSGIAYYPGTGLNPSYAGNIFITHFKGAVARSGVYTYVVKPKDASYEIVDSKPFLSAALPTDIRFGPDGRLYTSDWSDGYPKSRRGRIYAISDPKHVNDPLVKETQQLLASDWPKKSADELAKLLGHADWRVRLEAQYTLAERGEASIATLAKVATASAPAALEPGNPANLPAYARRHALWGLGQIAHGNKTRAAIVTRALAPVRGVARDADPEVRAQAIKLLGDHQQVDQADGFIAALKDESSRVKFFAAQGLGKLSSNNAALAQKAAPALLDALRANNDTDVYLRHALVMGLAGGKNLAALTAASSHESRAVRLGALLALRRLSSPEVARFLKDSDPTLVREAVLAINDRPIAGAMPALAALLAQPTQDEPVLYRAINANFRLGQPANAAALVNFAKLESAPAKMRAEALTQLGNWPTPPARDRIVGIYRPVAGQVRDVAVPRDALTPALGSLLDKSAPASVQAATLKAVDSLHVAAAADALYAVLSDETQPEGNRAAALSALDKIDDPRLPEAVKIASGGTNARLRLAAAPIAARLSPNDAAPILASLVKGSPEEQKIAYGALGTLKHPSADTLLLEQLKAIGDKEKVAPAAQLELLEAAAKRDNAELKKMLTDREVAVAGGGNSLAAFSFALAGGDRDQGLRVFDSHPVMACVRCHRVGTTAGGDAGPNLADLATRLSRDEILESIIKPNAKIAAGFDTVVVTRKSGGVAAGTVASENDTTLSLRAPDGKVVDVPKSDITKREGAPSSMPEIYGVLLTKAELRDVVEYLGSLRPFGGRGGAAGGAGGRGPGGAGGAGGAGNVPPPRALRGINTATPPPAATPANPARS